MKTKTHLKILGGIDEDYLAGINEKLEELGMIGCITLIQIPEMKYGMKKVKGKTMTFEIPEIFRCDSYGLVEICNHILHAKMPKARRLGYTADYLLGRDEAMDNVLAWYLEGSDISAGEEDTLEEILGYRRTEVYGEV